MPHRTRERIPGYCPVLVTLRVRDDDHVHLIVEAAGKVKLANGMKSVGARFARCVNRVFGRRGAVLKERFHHVVKRTPTEVRRALAYVLLNVRKHYRQRRKRIEHGEQPRQRHVRRWCWRGRVRGCGSTVGAEGRRRRVGMRIPVARARWRQRGRGCWTRGGGGSG